MGYDAGVLTDSRELADYFEACVKEYSDAKAVSNWINGGFPQITQRGESGDRRSEDDPCPSVRYAETDG